jgi:DNA-directed RNA polymerase subunit M/transcription elongation factor TFIIS
MIERIIDDPAFHPQARWHVVITPSCLKCGKLMAVSKDEKTLVCNGCQTSSEIVKSLDDVADDVLMHVKGNRHMKRARIREQAEAETEIQKREATG